MDQGLATWIVFERYLREREQEWDRKAFAQEEAQIKKGRAVLQSSRHVYSHMLGKVLLVIGENIQGMGKSLLNKIAD